MISSGLFILPAIAYSKAGPAIILSYIFASILIIPSVLSKAELATAMPKAGGTYFFIERSLGSVWGLFSGFASWFSLALKSAFAVVGMALLIELLITPIFQGQVAPLACQSNSGDLLYWIYNSQYSKRQTHKQTASIVSDIADLDTQCFYFVRQQKHRGHKIQRIFRYGLESYFCNFPVWSSSASEA